MKYKLKILEDPILLQYSIECINITKEFIAIFRIYNNYYGISTNSDNNFNMLQQLSDDNISNQIRFYSEGGLIQQMSSDARQRHSLWTKIPKLKFLLTHNREIFISIKKIQEFIKKDKNKWVSYFTKFNKYSLNPRRGD